MKNTNKVSTKKSAGGGTQAHQKSFPNFEGKQLSIMLLKCMVSFVILLTLTSFISGGPATIKPSRSEKSFPLRFGIPFGLDLAVSQCGIRLLRCPSSCAIDPVLIHGYCCECPGVYGYLPVHCPLDIICPFHPEPLCSDFNYLLDCCC